MREEEGTNVGYTKGSVICVMGLVARVSYPSLRKFMYVTACCIPSMHDVGAPRGLSEGCVGRIFEFLQTNFRDSSSTTSGE
jgi:hypothetical protein